MTSFYQFVLNNPGHTANESEFAWWLRANTTEITMVLEKGNFSYMSGFGEIQSRKVFKTLLEKAAPSQLEGFNTFADRYAVINTAWEGNDKPEDSTTSKTRTVSDNIDKLSEFERLMLRLPEGERWGKIH